VNRAPAKVQSALLESMQEGQVTIGEVSYQLPRPFWVIATQNPIEQEGTYPLPEAQVDRFLFRVEVGYPSEGEELEVLKRWAREVYPPPPAPLLSAEEVLMLQERVRQVRVAPEIERYMVRLTRATRDLAGGKLSKWEGRISWGASPRAGLALHRAARARALLYGRDQVLPEDIKAVAPAALAHRIILSYAAIAEGLSARAFIEDLLKQVPYQ